MFIDHERKSTGLDHGRHHAASSERLRLRAAQLVVSGKRVADTARSIGFGAPPAACEVVSPSG